MATQSGREAGKHRSSPSPAAQEKGCFTASSVLLHDRCLSPLLDDATTPPPDSAPPRTAAAVRARRRRRDVVAVAARPVRGCLALPLPLPAGAVPVRPPCVRQRPPRAAAQSGEGVGVARFPNVME